MEKGVKFATTDDFLATQPENVRVLLEKIRQTIRTLTPEAKEVISYQMPAFRLNKVFIFYAGFKNHISIFVPGITGEFKDELAGYKTSKATINIPFDKPLPAALLKKIVKFAAKRDADEAEKKKNKKPTKKKKK
jgi:uncharacterized protein YdhG (YjbR/CyaY superfamily)